jgi:hypothetical protein
MRVHHQFFFRHLRILRWAMLLSGLCIALWACTSHPLVQPTPDPGQETDAKITIVPMRHLDLVFMVDNSLSMKPKQDKLREQFRNLIDGLRDPVDGSLPDLRIAIIDSDLGAGDSTRCSKTGGYGDQGRFQMRDAADCGVQGDARWLEFTKGKPVNFTGEVSDVFGCLASAVGVSGCGYEHQLASIEWAFFLSDNKAQRDFIRPEAYLGIVLLTDEDDCSAPMESRMFQPGVATESPSLRCATRAHACNGADLPYPTTEAFSADYDACRARDDATCDESQVDTSQPTSCNPLLDVKKLAEEIKQIKNGGSEAEEKILVAAIYGRPLEGDTNRARYVIDKAPDPNPGREGNFVYDYWPVCYDPNFKPTSSGYDADAAGHGAMGGLRIDAFLNEFPAENRLAYSICEPDFGPAMSGIGKRLRNMMDSLCVPFKLADARPEPGLQPSCRVAYRKPNLTTKDGVTTTEWQEDDKPLPMCDSSRTPDCWEVKFGKSDGTADERDTAMRCPQSGSAPSQMINVVRNANDDLPVGTQVVMQCLSCVDMPPGMEPTTGCDY